MATLEERLLAVQTQLQQLLADDQAARQRLAEEKDVLLLKQKVLTQEKEVLAQEKENLLLKERAAAQEAQAAAAQAHALQAAHTAGTQPLGRGTFKQSIAGLQAALEASDKKHAADMADIKNELADVKLQVATGPMHLKAC